MTQDTTPASAEALADHAAAAWNAIYESICYVGTSNTGGREQQAITRARQAFHDFKDAALAAGRDDGMVEDMERAIAALTTTQAEPVAWHERQQQSSVKWTPWYACSPRRLAAPRSEVLHGIEYQWRPLYATTTPKSTQEVRALTDAEIDLIANDGMRNAAGGIYATRVYEFARAILAAASEGEPK